MAIVLNTGGNAGTYGAAGGSPSGNGAPGIIVITNIPVTTGLIWVDAQVYNIYTT